MKRSELRRGKGLQPGKALARGGALKRSAGLRSRPGRSRTSPEAVAALQRRSGGRCEVTLGGGLVPRYRCRGRAIDPHHRRTRTRAGRQDDSLANLLHCCRACHDWIHDHPAWSLERGYLLPSTH